MSLVFSVPGKTFLAGEYLVLNEGPALLFLSQPCFELTAKPGKGQVEGLHQNSPAGLFIRKHKDYFAKLDISFKDPHQGIGGFGASTAQFLSAYALWLYKEAAQLDMEKILDFKHILEAYYEVAWNGQGLRPSGADVVGQLIGSLTFFEKRQGLINVKNWPFSGLEFYLIHTGNKVATHEHLRMLKKFDTTNLEQSFVQIKESFDVASEEKFLEGIKSYAKGLKELNFTCEPTLNLLKDLQSIPGVRAAKGCGALGADVVLVITKKDFGQGVKQYCEIQGLKILASNNDIAPGLQVRGNL